MHARPRNGVGFVRESDALFIYVDALCGRFHALCTSDCHQCLDNRLAWFPPADISGETLVDLNAIDLYFLKPANP
jgi:hypothetical protein